MYKPRREHYPIALAAINAAISCFALPYSDTYGFVRVIAVASFAFFGVLCLFESRNVLFLARTFILGFIGYFPMMIKVLMGEEALFSGYERSTQGFDICVVMYVATSLALLSNQIGLALAGRNRALACSAPVVPVPTDVQGRELTYWTVAALAGTALTLFASSMFIRGYGQTILVAGYATEEAGEGLPFGSVAILGGMGIFCLYVAGLKGHFRHWKPLFVLIFAVFIIYSQLLMGVRQDAMSTLFGLVVLYGVANRRELGLKFKYVPLVILGYVFFEVWGFARTALADGISVFAIIGFTFSGVSATDAVRLGTISPIATTFSNTVFLVDHKFVELALGKSYLEWLLRIPPEVLYPNRPADYAWLFENYGLISGGGFFELAEVYMNFGLLGALFVPGIISFAMAKAYLYALHRQTPFSYFTLFAFLAIFLRGTWYQTFAFFRAFLVCVVVYVGFALIFEMLRASARLGSEGDRALYD